MKRDCNTLAYMMFGELPVERKKRTSVHQIDFGNRDTLGWKLKRKGCYAVADTEANNLYGMYLGEHNGQHVVGVLNLGSMKDFSATELFENKDEMQTHWVVE